MVYSLHIYHDEYKILAVQVEDLQEYSAIYLRNDPEEEGVFTVASNLSDINDTIEQEETWIQTLEVLLIQEYELRMFHKVDKVPASIIEKFNYWKMGGV